MRNGEENFDEAGFREKVQRAMETVRKVLEAERHPVLADEEAHEYSDKYRLAEQASHGLVSAVTVWLQGLGMDRAQLELVRQWFHSKKKSVTLRFEAEESCEFDSEHKRKEEGKTQVTSGILGLLKVSSTTVTTIVEYHWRFRLRYRVVVYAGSEPKEGNKRVLELGSASELPATVVTTTKHAPYPERSEARVLELSLDWLLAQLDRHGEPDLARLRIERDSKNTHTPRRNAAVDAAVDFCDRCDAFCDEVSAYFSERLFPIAKASCLHGPAGRATGSEPRSPRRSAPASKAAIPPPDFSSVHARNVFVPILPLLERKGAEVLLMDRETMRSLLDEQSRTLRAETERLRDTFQASEGSPCLIGPAQATLVLLMLHARAVAQQYEAAVDFVEHMLRTQLIASLGKVVQPAEFAEYMTFHARKTLRPACRPIPMALAVRRPHHYPEGVVSLMARTLAGDETALPTFVRADSCAQSPMYFALDAATEVAMTGTRYVHGAVLHRFAEEDSAFELALTARAGQFSSFILLVGKMNGPNVFAPKHAMVVRNRDDFRIPLRVSVIPSAKEFRDAVRALSPEQQQFAKAFRGMQLEGSILALAVVQIKPQLETLLHLPADSLTKEIKLTEDILELMVKYNIPSDLFKIGSGPPQNSTTPSSLPPSPPLSLKDSSSEDEEEIGGEDESSGDEHDPVAALELADAARKEAQKLAVCGADSALPEIRELAHNVHAVRCMIQDVRDAILREEAMKAALALREQLRADRLRRKEERAKIRLEAEVMKTARAPERRYMRSIQSCDEEEELMDSPVRYRSKGGAVGSALGGMALKKKSKAMPRKMDAAPKKMKESAVKEERKSSARMRSFSDDSEDLSMDVAMLTSMLDQECEQSCDDDFVGRAVDSIADGMEEGGGGGAPPAAKPQPDTNSVQDNEKSPENAPEMEEATPDVNEEVNKEEAIEKEKDRSTTEKKPADGNEPAVLVDVTAMPAMLDERFDSLDYRCPVRPTTLEVGDSWRRWFHANLLAARSEVTLDAEGQRGLRNEAFDLLDALSRSGGLPLASSELHVLLVSTHCFERSLIDSLVMDNINPIEKVEKSVEIMASTILGAKLEDIKL